VELIQIEQQDPRDTAVHTGGSLQELDPVAVRQMQVGGYQRHVLAVASQHMKLGDTVRRRACGQYSIVRSEPAIQRCHSGAHVAGIAAHDQQYGSWFSHGEAILSAVSVRRSAGFDSKGRPPV
jgi:hypothetical protein